MTAAQTKAPGYGHEDCKPSERAYQEVTCDRCGTTFVCTPSSDFYCAAEGDHCCGRCLLIREEPSASWGDSASDQDRTHWSEHREAQLLADLTAVGARTVECKHGYGWHDSCPICD